MSGAMTYLREFHFLSALFRLALALGVGGVVGYGRSQKRRSAGLRTYMLTCVGAALTILISMYEYQMLTTQWAGVVEAVGLKFDGSRFSAQVINGIGFLAAGTIIRAAHQQVSGLTTAIGLFTTAGLGVAIGSGFYECVLPALLLILLTMELMQPVEIGFKRRLRNMTVYVEYEGEENLGTITRTLGDIKAQIFELELEPGQEDRNGVRLELKLERGRASHSAALSSLAELPCVYSVQELIS